MIKNLVDCNLFYYVLDIDDKYEFGNVYSNKKKSLSQVWNFIPIISLN